MVVEDNPSMVSAVNSASGGRGIAHLGPSCRDSHQLILYSLQFVKDRGRSTVEQTVAVIEYGLDKPEANLLLI
jgi:hypothetical protein